MTTRCCRAGGGPASGRASESGDDMRQRFEDVDVDVDVDTGEAANE